LDDIESLIAIYEAKLDSLPEECFQYEPVEEDEENETPELGIAT